MEEDPRECVESKEFTNLLLNGSKRKKSSSEKQRIEDDSIESSDAEFSVESPPKRRKVIKDASNEEKIDESQSGLEQVS